jgi:MarR family transcriptional regulator, transcriptional regulator for hemolysin
MTKPVQIELNVLHQICFEMYDVARLLRKTMNERARELKLTQAQWRTLIHLTRMQGCRQADLADVLEVRPITLARLIDKLENAELVERKRHPTDRRAVQLYLKPAATSIMDRVLGIGTEVSESAMAGLSDEQREELLDNLQKMRANLSGKRPK